MRVLRLQPHHRRVPSIRRTSKSRQQAHYFHRMRCYPKCSVPADLPRTSVGRKKIYRWLCQPVCLPWAAIFRTGKLRASKKPCIEANEPSTGTPPGQGLTLSSFNFLKCTDLESQLGITSQTKSTSLPDFHIYSNRESPSLISCYIRRSPLIRIWSAIISQRTWKKLVSKFGTKERMSW